MKELYNNVPFYNEEFSKEPVLYSGLEPKIKNYPYISEFPVKNPKGAVVIFPGGGYFARGDAAAFRVAKKFNSLNYFAFVALYRVGNRENPEQGYRGNAIFADGIRAVQYARYKAKEYGYKSDKIAVCGFSAGGHLAMSLSLFDRPGFCADDEIGRLSSLPDACVLCYPVTTLLSGTFGNMPEILDFDDEKRNEFTGINSANKSTPPTFIWFGEEDSAVIPEKNSIPYYNKLKNIGVFCEMESFKEVGHGVGLAEGTNAESWSDHAAKFLNKVFK